MKKNIHPNWNKDIVVTCACGNTFTTGSMSDKLTVEICSKCHPFFTGEQKFVDTQGRVDKFMQKMQKAQKLQAQKAATKADKKVKKNTAPQKTYKQLLAEGQNKIKSV